MKWSTPTATSGELKTTTPFWIQCANLEVLQLSIDTICLVKRSSSARNRGKAKKHTQQRLRPGHPVTVAVWITSMPFPRQCGAFECHSSLCIGKTTRCKKTCATAGFERTHHMDIRRTSSATERSKIMAQLAPSTTTPRCAVAFRHRRLCEAVLAKLF